MLKSWEIESTKRTLIGLICKQTASVRIAVGSSFPPGSNHGGTPPHPFFDPVVAFFHRGNLQKMGVVIPPDVWLPSPLLFLLLFGASLASLLLFPFFVQSSSRRLDATTNPSQFVGFQRNFLVPYCLISVVGGILTVSCEVDFVGDGLNREQIVLVLSSGFAASLLAGTLLGILSDIIGQKRACIYTCLLQLASGIIKCILKYPSVCISCIFFSLSLSISSCSYETWMVTEHEKLGFRRELLSDTLWLMTFLESASLVGSQVMANSLIAQGSESGQVFSAVAASALLIVCIIYISRGWDHHIAMSSFKNYKLALSSLVLNDKRVLLLAWAHSSLYFSMAIFWLLWAPTLVADGREVAVGLIVPCLLGARMFGSTVVPWIFGGIFSVQIEDCLIAAFMAVGFSFSIIAYDYQEIAVLLALFCTIHGCVGLIVPSLARLRSMYVPNELRGGMMSLSLVHANAGILFVLVQGGYYRKLENSTIMAASSVGLFLSALCIHILKRNRWQRDPNQHLL